ncbi:hypothetical protein NC653_004868 [Populus alba x Populus x berolinensis]|uniref:Uncharacterized protein n=1 Tax=Populus alba x Populus x berolinensis TaxID=444605 RepID=A0AAD6WKI8_9ROSI|nr:hypothetical protein NC653_004868 [Populus alba x Populus x berolinensis]
MFGDWPRFMSNMGGNVVSSDTIYSLPIENPSYNFMSSMPFHTLSTIISARRKSKVGLAVNNFEEKSGNEEESSEQPPKKKTVYHRAHCTPDPRNGSV